MGSLADADAVAEVLVALRADQAVVDAFGSADHITGQVEGPWPHLVISPAGETPSYSGASASHTIAVEVVGPMDGTLGSAALRHLAVTVIEAVTALKDRDQPPGRAVICDATPGSVTRQPLTSGQVKWGGTVVMVLAPPQD